MTINEFNLLAEPEQDESVVIHGIYLLNYLQGDTMCDLYKLDDFYVKFCYDVNADDKVIITAFATNKDFSLFMNRLSH